MLKYTRYNKIDLTLFVVEPETPFSEWMSAIQSYEKEGATKYELFDTRKMTIVPNENDIEDILMYEHNYGITRPVGSKVAFVISNLKEYSRVRLFATTAKTAGVNWQTRAFFSIEEARSWLGIKLPLSLDIVSVDVKHKKVKREVRPPAE